MNLNSNKKVFRQFVQMGEMKTLYSAPWRQTLSLVGFSRAEPEVGSVWCRWCSEGAELRCEGSRAGRVSKDVGSGQGSLSPSLQRALGCGYWHRVCSTPYQWVTGHGLPFWRDVTSPVALVRYRKSSGAGCSQHPRQCGAGCSSQVREFWKELCYRHHFFLLF